MGEGKEGALEEGKESGDAVTAAVSMEVERLIINNGHNFCRVTNIPGQRSNDVRIFYLYLGNYIFEIQCLHSFPELRCAFLSELKGLFSLWKKLLSK